MLEVGMSLRGRYTILSQIGKGGMGAVFLAKDENLGITVAVKQNFFDEQRLIEAFKREARLLAGLRHTALPQVKDYFIEGAGQYLVMEYIAGDDLGTVLQKHQEGIPTGKDATPFDVNHIVLWAEQLLDALDYLHTRSEPIIHRDIKPQNLKLAERNQIILLDFGLAKGKPLWMTRATTTGSLYGYTPNYAPIEQIRGLGTDPRSDLYALGATLYHLLTLVPPIDSATRADAFLGSEPDPLLPANHLNPNVPDGISTALMKAMEPHRNNRFSSAVEMLEALRNAKGSTVVNWQARKEEQSLAADEPPKDQAHWLTTEVPELQEEAARLAREAAEPQTQQDHLRRPLQSEDDERPQKEHTPAEQNTDSPQNKLFLRIGGGLLLAVLVIWVIVAILNRSDGQTGSASMPTPDNSRKSEAVTLKPGTFPTPARVYKASLSDDGRVLASTGDESVVRVWTLTGEKQLNDPAHKGRSVAVSPDGGLVASGSKDGSIRIWRLSDGQLISAFEAHSDYVFSVGFNIDGQTLFSAGGDKKIKVWRASDGAPLKTVETPEKGYLIITVSGDLRLAGFYNREGSFKLWSVEQDDLLRMLDGDIPRVNCGAFTSGGQLLALGSRDGEVQVWRTIDGRMMKALGIFNAEVFSLAFTSDGKTLAAGFGDGVIRVWNVSDGTLINTLEGHTGSADTLAFSADGSLLASGSEDRSVRLWGVLQK